MNLGRFLYYGDFIAIPLVIASLFLWIPGPLTYGVAVKLLLCGALGITFWTLLEYLIHRFAYHDWPLLSRYHEQHHARPIALLGFPSFVSIGLIVALVFTPLISLDATIAVGATCGMLIGYLVYVFVHHASHHIDIAPAHPLYRARMRHLAHHRDDTCNFGVSTRVWDVVFGTRRNSTPVQAIS